ncbi:hypothetical protein K1719_024626 [Acacia pycnantha]|nr:hypothetical protein K1719_024626 [Acacia pycnantha]
MDAETISRSSGAYIGKLRSNFLGTKFLIYDTRPPHNYAQLPPPQLSQSRRYYSKKVSPKVPSGSYNILISGGVRVLEEMSFHSIVRDVRLQGAV